MSNKFDMICHYSNGLSISYQSLPIYCLRRRTRHSTYPYRPIRIHITSTEPVSEEDMEVCLMIFMYDMHVYEKEYMKVNGKVVYSNTNS